MAFESSISRWLRLLGGPDVSTRSLAQPGNGVITLPELGAFFWPGRPRAGYVRVKQNTLGRNGRTQIGVIQATDGINVANIYSGDTNFSANSEYIDKSFLFVYDWQVANINVNITTANANSTYDVEIVGVR